MNITERKFWRKSHTIDSLNKHSLAEIRMMLQLGEGYLVRIIVVQCKPAIHFHCTSILHRHRLFGGVGEGALTELSRGNSGGNFPKRRSSEMSERGGPPVIAARFPFFFFFFFSFPSFFLWIVLFVNLN